MNSYLSKSHQKVWWICEINPCGCHIWPSEIKNRTGKKSIGCPYCATNPIPCIHNNLEVQFPHLIIEWDPNNLKEMNEYTSHSGSKVLWICKDSPCGCHKWPATIGSRTLKDKPKGCPYCKSGKICSHNNLEIRFPELKCEWDPNNLKQMCEYPSGSGDIVSWICQNGKCGCHKWLVCIQKRTDKDRYSRCPFCKQGKVCEHNNLEVLFQHLKIEWDPDNSKLMKEFSFGSNVKIKWICSKNPLYMWPTTIDSRTKKDGTNCPHCSKSKGYSDAEINWLISIEKRDNIIIRNALSPEGQFKITGKIKVDGYCEQTKTVYEFHGDYWHGNPLIYDRNETNNSVHKTFGELYDKTIAREQKIRDLGFNLIVKWETDFSDIEPKVEELNDVFYIKINTKSKSTFTHY